MQMVGCVETTVKQIKDGLIFTNFCFFFLILLIKLIAALNRLIKDK